MLRPMAPLSSSLALLGLSSMLSCLAAEKPLSNSYNGSTPDAAASNDSSSSADTSPQSESGLLPTADSGSTADAPSDLAPPPDVNVPLTLPFAPDNSFAPGFMGDGQRPGNLADSADCPARQGDQQGWCHHIIYTPSSQNWAGVFWLAGEQNWGTSAGQKVEAGATKITFWAWSTGSGETIKFFAGLDDPALAYHDTFRVEQEFRLTTTPTQYQLDLSQAYYDAVIGAFGWAAAAHADMSPTEFYFDDIQWTK
ncbi:MAG: hypothetical protein MUF54_00925 [Polyangiaceae bacterium]|nr:hypothetical protein [Polyangiaceae bacterium]